jgi:SAM-dependent methyltransferase
VKARRRIIGLLKALGALDAAREARDSIQSLRWFRANWLYWRRGAPDRLPIPPLRLVRLTTGTSSLAWTFEGGALAAESIRGVLEKNGVDIGRLESILDFGCGCGRVVRQWADLGAGVHGCDYNPAYLAWCRRNLPFARFERNALEPPLPYRDQQFDLVYALSVFTHLPERLLQPWMRELRRVLKPGGFLIITTHGEAYVDGMNADEQRKFHAGEVVVRGEDAAGTNRCGVYFSEQFIGSTLAEGLRVVDFVPRGARGNPHQDLMLLQKPSA